MPSLKPDHSLYLSDYAAETLILIRFFISNALISYDLKVVIIFRFAL